MAEPSAKKPRLSLKLKKNNDDGEPTELNFTRFESPEKSLESYQRGFVPKNTEVNTKWAVRNFNEWMSEYNSRHSDKPCPEDILLTDSSSDLSYWLQKYVLGTRKKGGQCYPPKTVYLLLCGLNRFMKEHKKQSFNIFDRENPDFNNTCDSYFRELRENGVGSASKVINREDEEILWSSGVLSASSARGLLNAVFFLNGKNFALRGGIEHRCLKLSHIVRNTSPEGKIRYTYTENCSKNRAGGFNQLNVPNKVVHQYQNLQAGERCHVFILDKYLSKLPANAADNDIFYLRPAVTTPVDVQTPWYTSVPIGKNPLSKMFKNMCDQAGISGNKSNHSLRAYAVTELFNAGVPEKVIQDRTGHRSLEGLRKYERISEEQKEIACKVLAVTNNEDESIVTHDNEPSQDMKPAVLSPTTSCQDLNPAPNSCCHSTHESLSFMQNLNHSSEQFPTCTFGSAGLHGCTINIYQAPKGVFQLPKQ